MVCTGMIDPSESSEPKNRIRLLVRHTYITSLRSKARRFIAESDLAEGSWRLMGSAFALSDPRVHASPYIFRVESTIMWVDEVWLRNGRCVVEGLRLLFGPRADLGPHLTG